MESVTVKVAFVVPVFPSITETSLIVSPATPGPVQPPSFKKTDAVLAWSAVAASDRPSPLKSPTTTASGEDVEMD